MTDLKEDERVYQICMELYEAEKSEGHTIESLRKDYPDLSVSGIYRLAMCIVDDDLPCMDDIPGEVFKWFFEEVIHNGLDPMEGAEWVFTMQMIYDIRSFAKSAMTHPWIPQPKEQTI